MHARHALHAPGKLNQRLISRPFGFHVAIGAQLGEHLLLNPPLFAADRLPLAVFVWCAVRCLLPLNPALLTGTQAFRNLGGHLATTRGRHTTALELEVKLSDVEYEEES